MIDRPELEKHWAECRRINEQLAEVAQQVAELEEELRRADEKYKHLFDDKEKA